MLLVEDNTFVARAFERLVGGLAKVVIAPTLKEAKAALETRPWAALVVDIALPDGSGLDALAFAREHGYRGPALVYSAYHNPVDINRAYQLDAKYLVKPGSGEVLRGFVATAVKPRRRPPLDRWVQRYKLTRAETSILRSAVAGWTHDQIAAHRLTSLMTTKKQINTMLAKTGDASLTAAAARLLRERRR